MVENLFLTQLIIKGKYGYGAAGLQEELLERLQSFYSAIFSKLDFTVECKVMWENGFAETCRIKETWFWQMTAVRNDKPAKAIAASAAAAKVSSPVPQKLLNEKDFVDAGDIDAQMAKALAESAAVAEASKPAPKKHFDETDFAGAGDIDAQMAKALAESLK